ncbi:MAG TPA: response regulator transcription factor [Thermomicrobiales bacterium]|nr:response regulator transcription factor [Thermomicrobiales bacterium]
MTSTQKAPEQSILVVEDERTLADALRFNLERQGYAVHGVDNGYDAVDFATELNVDLVILDVMLPGIDGLEVCRRIRARSDVPILMLTARGEEIDRVLGLEIGADDYLTKPFSLRELIARVRALLRRSGRSVVTRPASAARESGDLKISTAERRAWKGDTELVLRPREFELLAFLMHNHSLALTRQQLLDGAWDAEFQGDERTVDVHIRGLRELIESDPRRPTRIVTVRGVGYRFEG